MWTTCVDEVGNESDHQDEDYEAPKGANTSSTTMDTNWTEVVSNASPSDQAANEKSAKDKLATKESQPTTQIQVRLSDGSRVIIKANHTHKVADLRQYINT